MLIRHLFATVVSFPWTCSHTSWGVPFRAGMFLGSSHTEPQLGVLRCLGIGDAIYAAATGSCYWLKVNTILWPSVIFQPWTMDSSGSFSWIFFIPRRAVWKIGFGPDIAIFPAALIKWPFLGAGLEWQLPLDRGSLVLVGDVGSETDLGGKCFWNVLDQKGMDSLPIGSIFMVYLPLFTYIYHILPLEQKQM